MPNFSEYPFEIRRLIEDEGSGFLINFPDFNECFSDGATVIAAIENGMDALDAAIQTLEELGLPVPTPLSAGSSGQLITRVPKSLRSKLVAKAEREHVSLNRLVTTLLAEGVGQAAGG